MDVPPIEGPVVAFCGIARSEQFFAGLEAAGLHLASRIAFPDHHNYKDHDLDCIQGCRAQHRRQSDVTTEKDLVRLGRPGRDPPEAPLPLKTSGMRIEIEDEAAAIAHSASTGLR